MAPEGSVTEESTNAVADLVLLNMVKAILPEL